MCYEVLTATTAKVPVFKNVVPSHLIGSNSLGKSAASIFGVEVTIIAAESSETYVLS
jgi:hypothetical protein